MCEMNVSEALGSCRIERHVHEITGSTQTSERCRQCHNHRFATVSGEPIPFRGSHVHNVEFRTDSYEGHIHEFCGTSSIAIPVGDGRHVHFASARTTAAADGHTHEFRVAALIEDPTSERC